MNHKLTLTETHHDAGDNFLKNWLEDRYDRHIVQDILSDVIDLRRRDFVSGLLQKLEDVQPVNDNNA